IFRIRRGIQFHEGQTLTAEDVKFSLEYYQNPAVGATRGAALREILASIDILDADTERLNLKAPNATILQLLALRDVPIISKEWTEAGHDYRTEYNGTGPFRMKEAVRGETYHMVRNE